MNLIFVLLLGVLFGFIIGILFIPKQVGSIHFYDMEFDEPPVMTAELYKNPEDIRKRRLVTFRVSQK